VKPSTTKKKVHDELSERSSLLQKLLYTLPVDILYRQMSPLMSGYNSPPKAVPLCDCLWNTPICTAQHYPFHTLSESGASSLYVYDRLYSPSLFQL